MNRLGTADLEQAKLQALERVQAIIEFDPKGNILRANDNFLTTMGYSLGELIGQHHRMFVEPEYAESAQYRDFWNQLQSGHAFSDEFKRRRKDGSEIWIQASYNPIVGKDGKVDRVVKFATDITEQNLESQDFAGKMAAIDKVQAVIEFHPDGTIITANDNFLGAMGYALDEVRGQHHRMFVEPDYGNSKDYQAFWAELRSGEPKVGEFKRLDKNGQEVWISAAYNPILDKDGRVAKVVKFASDITEQKLKNADFAGKMAAIDKVQAVIEFHPDGTIITANDNFLGAMGYSLDEIRGQHHRMFVESSYGNSRDYEAFWSELRSGEPKVGEFKRFDKHGREIWISAAYNPIFDDDGRVVKVVKFASDITEQKQKNADFAGKMAAIDKVQAVIEFRPDGTITTANDNFLGAMGYSLDEIRGQHHRMFVESSYGKSQDYEAFWAELRSGKPKVGEFKRLDKTGREVWISAAYNPILDDDGRVLKVVKFASDITEQKVKNADFAGKMAAIDKVQAVIEFHPDGTIITANDNFLGAMGYALHEVQGQHHRMFVDPNYGHSADYEAFWTDLRRGAPKVGEFKRCDKQGREIWISAAYNPIFDDEGRVVKVVKFASDITEQRLKNADFAGKMAAIDKVQAVIEFQPDGTIITANDNFLGAMGYALHEIQGQHHRMFVEPDFGRSGDYEAFWADLRRGEPKVGEFKRRDRQGRDIWISAAYNPILDDEDRVVKVVKFASDITEQRLKNADFAGKMAAIDKVQAVIEFNPDGTIITANDNFLGAMGYALQEIQGRHHKLFVEPDYAQSRAYEDFWSDLRAGTPQVGTFKRRDKHGGEIWIHAAYNPILDDEGRVLKVVKFATDVTEQQAKNADFAGKMEAIGKVQAVIEFRPDGTIVTANDNFLGALGYTLDEIRGKHHRMFVEPAYGKSEEYRAFWKDLAGGTPKVGEYERFGKAGQSVWISASYNPILDSEGRVMKVVKFATDVTDRVRAVEETVHVASSLAKGDLTQLMTGDFTGSFATLRDSLNASTDTLREMVGEVRGRVGTITSAISEIRNGNNDLNGRTQSQAAALQETSASVQEMTGSIKRNADNASEASRLTESARSVAEQGQDVVNRTVDAMSEINTASRKISDIIGVIDELSFQTNLLALNAAVEAARAGEQGRGFAVVATEVRNLAQRSAVAAKEIKALINNSVEKVDQGAKLVDATGDTFAKIVLGVKRVSDIVSEIASSNREQATGIDEVNAAISQIDESTQQNAAMAEETTAASDHLAEQAKGLETLVAAFELGSDGPSDGQPNGHAALDPVMSENGATTARAQLRP